MDIIEESLNILRINSVSQTGNLELVDYLARLLDKLGLPYEIQSTTHRGVPQQNLICRIEGSSSEEILFNTHLDTVSPGDPKKWHTTGYDPFSPRIEGDKIYGLGSA
ncbi:MAG: M20 family peptidase, partial [Spirochaetota bacterium]|nr:M20 family peptidase [Spirochaetota bacterium]